MVTRRAIIAGGGIAGLAVARGLLGLGWEVTVYEQAPTFTPVGAGITLAPNGVRALSWLGLGDQLRSISMAHGEAAIRDSSGRWLLRTSVEAFEQRFGVPTYALHRADLHRLLMRAVDGADMRTGHRVTGVRLASAPAVTFDGPDGAGEDHADLVVAADGIDSSIRSALFDGHPGTSYAGYITWRGVVPSDGAPPGSRDVGVTETWGRGARFGIVPLGDGQVYWFATGTFPAGSHDDDDLEDLRSRFASWHDPIAELLLATPATNLLKHDIYYLKQPLPRHSVDRVVLVGDAAHAMTPDLGQGGCQALEDAVTLTDALAGETDIAAALEHYEHARKARAERIARTSAFWGKVAEWRHPVAAMLRNTLVAAVPARLVLRLSEATLGWRPPRPAGTELTGGSGV